MKDWFRQSWSKTVSRFAARPAAELDAAARALVADAEAAARLRTYRTNPHVAALTIERTRDRLDRWGWLFLFAGLAYTTVNVQAFVADTAEAWSLRWSTAWLVEPMVMGLMLVLLRGEQIANRYGEKSGRWVTITRWISLLITYVMNTGKYWSEGNSREVFVHSVPVLLVFLAAEALVQQRLTLTAVVEALGQDVLGRPETSQSGSERPDTSQDDPDRPDEREEDQESADELADSRTLKERAYAAFCELAAERGGRLDSIGPAEVDRRAGVRPGTSKVTGRMGDFRARYLVEEVSDGDHDRAEA